MKKVLIIFTLILPVISHAQCYESLRFIKRIFNPDKDNRIYKRERIFHYDYQYVKQDTSYRVATTNGNDFHLVHEATIEPSSYIIKQISFKVIKPKLFTRTSKYQSETVLNYDPVPLRSWQGLVENKHNVWLHPPRRFLFKILELNPFPYVKYPLSIGTRWIDSLSIGDHWSDPRWKVWKGRILNRYTYEVKGNTSISVESANIPCWIIEAKGESTLGSTQTTSYFNEKYGFVQLDYINIDGSKITLKLNKFPTDL